MGESTEKNKLSRKLLTDLFANGKIPQAADFESMVDAMVNKNDDGFDKDAENGLMLRNTGKSSNDSTGEENYNKFISVYKNLNDTNENFFFSLEKDTENTAFILNTGTAKDAKKIISAQVLPDNKRQNFTGLLLMLAAAVPVILAIILKPEKYIALTMGACSLFLLIYGAMIHVMSGPADNKDPRPGKYDRGNDEKKFYFGKDGNMGIGKKAHPQLKLDVNGFVGMAGRVGNYGFEESPERNKGTVKADAKWHKILSGLNGCTGWEIIARARGKDKSGNHAILHAIALSAFSGSRGYRRIRTTSSRYGSILNKLCLRWVRDSQDEYSLEIRTVKNYGDKCLIWYRITQLWDDKLIEDADQQASNPTSAGANNPE